MKKLLFLATAALLMTACGNKKADDPIGDSGRTLRTENLLNNLIVQGDSGVYLFGHQDDTAYGIGWMADYANDSTIHQRSDVKSVCNDFPSLLSFDVATQQQSDSLNMSGIPFFRIRQDVIAHFDRGGAVSLSWTIDKGNPSDKEIDRIAQFINSLVTPYGVKVPVIFRLRGAFTKQLWQRVHQRMADNEVVNILYAYANQADADEERYLERYPGDDIIDLLGVDCYCQAEDADTTQIADYTTRLDKSLTMVCDIAKKRHKAVALTETGYECIKTKDWWTKTLAPILAKHPISYVLLWRNAHDRINHYFAPYPGQPSASDFVHFYNDRQTLFLQDVNGLYLE